MRIGSLFSGIGGLELGLERAGVGQTVWQCEQDPYARRVLARHWPDVVRFDDVRTMGIDAPIPAVDVICGGFPCQDISNAGKQEGIHGARSGLFFEIMRIADLVRPRYLVLENVAALLYRGMGTVLGALASGGYDAVWDCIPAQSVGAPHRRDRIFLIAWPISDAHGPEIWDGPKWAPGKRYDVQGCGQPQPGHHGPAGNMAHPISISGGTGPQSKQPKGNTPGERTSHGGWWSAEPDVGRVANGVPCRVDRLRCLGNAVVPQVAEVVGRALMEIHHA